MKNWGMVLIIVLFLGVGFSVAGLSGGIDFGVVEPIVSDKQIPDTEYQEIKTVLTKGNVVIDDKVGLDVSWKEVECIDTICKYELYKENLFSGAEITVDYNGITKPEEKVTLLENKIQEKIENVVNVWKTRQALDAEKSEPITETQTGTTNIISDKPIEKEIEEIKE